LFKQTLSHLRFLCGAFFLSHPVYDSYLVYRYMTKSRKITVDFNSTQHTVTVIALNTTNTTTFTTAQQSVPTWCGHHTAFSQTVQIWGKRFNINHHAK